MSTTKTQVPDGKGGWTTVEGEVHAGAAANPERQAAALGAAFIEEAGALTERIMAFDVVYMRDLGLTNAHRVFAAALYVTNLRESYPDGVEAFDAIAKAAGEYYDLEDAAAVKVTR